MKPANEPGSPDATKTSPSAHVRRSRVSPSEVVPAAHPASPIRRAKVERTSRDDVVVEPEAGLPIKQEPPEPAPGKHERRLTVEM